MALPYRVATALPGAQDAAGAALLQKFNPLHHSCLCGAQALALELLPPDHNNNGARWQHIDVAFRADSDANTVRLRVA